MTFPETPKKNLAICSISMNLPFNSSFFRRAESLLS
uniref:Uncharacterized protein n=1 Tax=Arundo donax TaxID=35708 RepID=A0A0A9D6S1_ARUDO